MPKEIKVIRCPNCGSTENTELKPDFFKCSNCGTEYFLDNDDVNVNVTYHNAPSSNIKPPNGQNPLVIIVFLGIIFVALSLFIVTSQHKTHKTAGISNSPSIDLYGNGDLVYTNALTNSPIYLRIGREDIEGPNNSVDYVNVYAVFIDPILKKEIKRSLLFPKSRRLDDHDCYFHTFVNGDVYGVYNKTILLKLDTKTNTLVDFTSSFLSKHTEVSNGIASMTLSESDDGIVIMTNDGGNVFYSPLTDKFYENYHGQEDAKFAMMQKPFYQFVDTDRAGITQVAVKLVKLNSTDDPKTLHYTNLTGNRKFFDREIIYQDPANLLIFAHITAAETSPTTLQSIDVNTGKVKWAINRSASFSYKDGVKCSQGFALHYGSGEDMNYITGVYVIAPDGKLVSDYSLERAQ